MTEELKFETLKIDWPTLKDNDGNVLREGTIDGNYAVISINRPDRLNALTEQVVGEISLALRHMELDDSVRAVVIRGVKEYTKKPAFSAGADLAAAFNPHLKPNIPMHMAIAMRIRHRDYDEFEQFSKPLIAAVDGFALGGGCEIVLCCDIVIASDRSRFGLPEINRGIFPANGGVTRMAARVGVNRALRMAFFGEAFDAKTMEEWGLVSWRAPAGDEFEQLVHEKAKWLGDAPTTALFVIKKCVKFGTRYTELGLMMEQLGFGVNQASHDAKEGILAFNRKIKCPECAGKGKFEDGSTCPKCSGNRKIKDTPHFKGI
ncbi:MAG: enoyl-CoA hydratase-related protein [Candidatus Lokiarchaeota archaeon]|nr:enoyl-CoA hydratase-related protein [Candidatus Lokiarchaeota archaeon]